MAMRLNEVDKLKQNSSRERRHWQQQPNGKNTAARQTMTRTHLQGDIQATPMNQKAIPSLSKSGKQGRHRQTCIHAARRLALSNARQDANKCAGSANHWQHMLLE
jgi:hypothetical protein